MSNMADKILKFKMWADFGHFGMRYTTSSKATHLIPPRHTISGMIGAILGIEREKLSETFYPKNCRIGIAPAAPLHFFRITLKQLLLKKRSFRGFIAAMDRSLIPFQMLRNPAYYIYFNHNEEELYDRLRAMLVNHECIYPPSFGMAQLLADFEFLGEYDVDTVEEREITTSTVAPADAVSVSPKEGNRIVIDKMAHWLNHERVSQQFQRVLFDANGGELEVTINDLPQYVELMRLYGSEEVIFLW